MRKAALSRLSLFAQVQRYLFRAKATAACYAASASHLQSLEKLHFMAKCLILASSLRRIAS